MHAGRLLLFLDPSGTRGDFFHIAVNALGTIFDGRWSSNPYAAWDGDGIEAARSGQSRSQCRLL